MVICTPLGNIRKSLSASSCTHPMASKDSTPPVVSTMVLLTLLFDNLIRLNLSSEGDTAAFRTSLLMTCTGVPLPMRWPTIHANTMLRLAVPGQSSALKGFGLYLQALHVVNAPQGSLQSSSLRRRKLGSGIPSVSHCVHLFECLTSAESQFSLVHRV